MTKNILAVVLGILITLLIPASVFALQDFEANPSSLNLESSLSQAKSSSITISNTGDENINLSISKIDLTSGSNTITLNLDKTSIENLVPTNTQTLIVSFNSGTNEGIFTGSVKIENTQNSSQTITVPITLNVSTQEGASIAFRDYGSTLTMKLNVDDSKESESFYLVNTGSLPIEDIEIKLDDLDGDDDEIGNDDIEINGERADETLKLNDLEDDNFAIDPGDDYKLKIEIDIPSNLDVDDYRGDLEIEYKAGGETFSRTFTLKVETESDNEDVYIDQTSLYVRNGILEVIDEAGETVDDLEITIINDASFDVSDLILELDGDLEEENSANVIPASAVRFIPNNFDVDERDEDDIDIEIEIPDDQAVGTYLADIDLISSTGKKLDSIVLKVKVTGDIFVSKIEFDDNAKPGDVLDVDITVENRGSQIYRNIKVTGILFDIDASNSNIVESSTNFLLEINGERTETLRYKIPEDATDGSHTLEVRVSFDSTEIIEVETIDIERPLHKIDLLSNAVSPSLIECEGQIFSFMRIQNLGRFEEEIQVSTEITGTSIKKESTQFDLSVDETVQRNLILDVRNLETGTYEVVQKITYANNLFIRKTSSLRYTACGDKTGGGIDIKPINETTTDDTDTTDDKNKINFFGSNIDKSTAYLASGLGIVIVLIVISLFLL